MRFAAGPEHAPTRQAQLLVELEDAGLEGFLQFGLAGIERLLKLELTRHRTLSGVRLRGYGRLSGGRPGRLEGGFLRESKRLELGCKLGIELRLEGPLLGQQQGFEHRRIVGQLRREDGCAHADGGVRTRGGGAVWHAEIIPDHAT